MANVDHKDANRGLYGKFHVERSDGRSAPGEKHDGCEYVVLDLDHDPHALPALKAYEESCRADFPQLADDLQTARLSKQLPTSDSGSVGAEPWDDTLAMTPPEHIVDGVCACGAEFITSALSPETKCADCQVAPPTSSEVEPGGERRALENIGDAIKSTEHQLGNSKLGYKRAVEALELIASMVSNALAAPPPDEKKEDE